MELKGKRLVLGVTGGIAAYKAAELVRLLVREGAEVQVAMSEGATHFVTPTTFQALSGRPVYLDQWDARMPNAMAHIDLSRQADLLLVAPAMNRQMWENPAAATVGTSAAFGAAIEPTGTAAEKGILSGSLTNINKSTVTGGTVYTFGTGTTSGVVGFYPYNGTTLGAHKAFLVKTTEMPSKDSSGLILSIDDSADEPTAISGLSDDSNTKDNAPYYNLQGIRVKTPIQGGIYIHNGKKIVIY